MTNCPSIADEEATTALGCSCLAVLISAAFIILVVWLAQVAGVLSNG